MGGEDQLARIEASLRLERWPWGASRESGSALPHSQSEGYKLRWPYLSDFPAGRLTGVWCDVFLHTPAI